MKPSRHPECHPVKGKPGWFYFDGNPETRIHAEADIGINANISGMTRVRGSGRVLGNARVSGSSVIYGVVQGYAQVTDTKVGMAGKVSGTTTVEQSTILGKVCGYASVKSSTIYPEASACELAYVGPGENLLAGTLRLDRPRARILKWDATLVAPSVLRIGCQQLTFEEWLAPENNTRVPWDTYTPLRSRH